MHLKKSTTAPRNVHHWKRERERDERESIDIWIFVIFVANQPPATSVRGSSD